MNSNGKVIDSLFDITLNESVENYISSDYINSNNILDIFSPKNKNEQKYNKFTRM